MGIHTMVISCSHLTFIKICKKFYGAVLCFGPFEVETFKPTHTHTQRQILKWFPFNISLKIPFSKQKEKEEEENKTQNKQTITNILAHKHSISYLPAYC